MGRLAKEVGRFNIQVNVVCPEATDTKMTANGWPILAKAMGISYETWRDMMANRSASGKIFKSEDIVPVVVFLATKNSDYLTGRII